jgi:hypothetical protein
MLASSKLSSDGFVGSALDPAHNKMAESARTPPSLLEHSNIQTQIIRMATASKRPAIESVAHVG